MAKQLLSAIMDEDLKAVLARIGLLQDLEDGHVS